MTRLAFLGPRATFTEQALLRLPESEGAELVPAATTTSALAAVRSGEADLACVPIENSVEGGVPAVLDSLVNDPPLVIVRETQIAVRFALMVRPGTALGDIRTVASHPHGEAQTRHWLAANLPGATISMSSSTAEAAAQVARGELDASVSAPVAASVHGLEILADDIADTAAAVTRFVLVRPPCAPPEPTAFDRTTLATTTENVPGALLGILTELAVRGIDLTRIESRPIKGRRDEYWFHLDCTGHIAQPAMGEALAALHRRCTRVRYLGSYARCAVPDGVGETRVSPASGLVNGHGAERFAAAAAWLDEIRAGTSA
ncbi:prephenate dehydratase [Pseudonocardia spinosispora]|uniref:prephenate dehydratase n=1 Tax=Pseudonocardia spinosispora TaxID=103441 RepID=UPI00041FF522|nr:prephenate dehydratase [Pseudonocardia spinosispora]